MYYRRWKVMILFIVLLSDVCGIRVVSRQNGDIMLGALFPIHAKGTNQSCGNLQRDDGIQPLEALHYTLDQINRDPNLLPNITLGVVALDSCDNIVYALDQCLDFVKGTVEKSFVMKMQDQDKGVLSKCSTGGPDGSSLMSNIVGQQPVVGVIGDQSSDITIQVTSLLRIFKIPLISYQSTSPTLSDRERFAYFFRTVPSDVTQAFAILEILRNFNWTYASLVYEESEYGLKGYETLTRLSPSYGVCFAAQIRIDYPHFNDSDYDDVMEKLLSQSRIVVLFSGKSVAANLMAATKRVSSLQKNIKLPIWVGSDGWSNREKVTQGLSAIVEGAITVQPLVRRHLDGFESYFMSLRPETNTRNPWFSEYWQELFTCKLTSQLPPGIPPGEYSDPCKRNFHINDKRMTSVKYLQFVRDAVYAYAHALHNQWEALCHGHLGVCKEMLNADGSVLKSYLERATFTDQNNRVFKFYNGGDGPPRYSVLNFQKVDDDSYTWKEIGSFYRGADDQPNLEIDRKLMHYRRYERSYPNSTCKEHCDPKKGLVPYLASNETNSCCPDCKQCERFEMIQGGHCLACPNGKLPDESRSRCILIEEEIIDYSNPWAAGAMAFAVLGILLTLSVAFVFWSHRHTPVIKASGRELSAILLLATLCSFAMTFLIASRPSPTKCAVTRFSLGLTHTLAFAAIAVKTNRVARIFGKKTNTTVAACPRAKYISPRSQLAITGALTLIEVIVNVSWLIYEPPQTAYIFPDRFSRVLICEGMDNYTYLVGLVYPLLLIGCCTVYAFQTRKCPGGFNEARFIGFTTYTTCVLWMAFIPLFLTAPSSVVRIVTLAMSLSISGLVQLACLFVPKIYIVLCKPEKNTREGVMAQHRSSSYALPTPPAIALNSLQHATSSISNGRSAIILQQQKQGQLSPPHQLQSKSQPNLCPTSIIHSNNHSTEVSDCEDNNKLTPNNSQLHINASSESIIYVLPTNVKGERSKVHFRCDHEEEDQSLTSKSTDQLNH